ncbi:hypothetical protein [Solimonas soli]|uniref:hypothetical protein n=1 Tax=Solimonas soli TaxID=413479 RepID=UPI00048518F9|nr:hypothetical protein [Solimonas soli]
MEVIRNIAIRAALLGVAIAALPGCGSDAPKPLEARNVSAPLKPVGLLPPGLATSLKEGDVVALKVPLTLRLHPKAGSGGETLPPGAIVRLKSRVLNAAGPWWLVDGSNASGWLTEAELLRK